MNFMIFSKRIQKKKSPAFLGNIHTIKRHLYFGKQFTKIQNLTKTQKSGLYLSYLLPQ